MRWPFLQAVLAGPDCLYPSRLYRIFAFALEKRKFKNETIGPENGPMVKHLYKLSADHRVAW
jgi:hypothetical protein